MKNIHVDFGKKVKAMKPLHGVNNGPKTYGLQVDTSAFFKEAGIPFSRLHDTEYPLGSGYFVDVPCIFKDFDADPEDPASYDFRLTDAYLLAIKDCGTDIIYRLGVSIENSPHVYAKPVYIYPPKDNVKWAKICIGIIRHYNEGWANGYHLNIKFWEIWNEPESGAMWQGTREQFYELYTTAAPIIKAACPEVYVGGYATIGFYPTTRADKPCFCDEPYIDLLDYIGDFLASVKRAGAPLDFFSWHLYSSEPEEYVIHAAKAQEMLEEYGFENAVSILDEWNMQRMEEIHSNASIAFITAILCTLQKKTRVEIGTYYDAQPAIGWWNGIFKRTTKGVEKTKAFYSFKTYNELFKLGTEVQSSCDSGLYVCGAVNDTQAGVIISNYQGTTERITLELRGFAGEEYSAVKVYCTDDDHTCELVREEKMIGDRFTIYLDPKENTSFYVELRK